VTATTTTTTTHHRYNLDDILDSKPMLWWTKEERCDILERNQSIVKDYTKHHPLHIQRIQRVFRTQCCSWEGENDDDYTSSSSISSFSSTSDDDDEEDKDDDRIRRHGNEQRCRRGTRRYRSACSASTSQQQQQQRQYYDDGIEDSDSSLCLPTCVRGLEFGILPEAKAHRKTHVQRVLDWQQRISNLSVDRQVTILGEQSSLSSQRSRRLARLLAQNDATATTTTTSEGGDGSSSSSVVSSFESDNNDDDGSTGIMSTHGYQQRPQRRPRMIPSWM
jgi:hypothetical protein